MCAGGCIAFFHFRTLCGRPTAAADYIALVTRYHSLALSGIPKFGAITRAEAYRFMTLIDVLYEHKCDFFTLNPCVRCPQSQVYPKPSVSSGIEWHVCNCEHKSPK